MSESIQIFLTDTHARVPNGLGGYKSITLKDFGTELLRVAEDQEESSVGQSIRFPNEMVAMNFTDRRIDMMLYFPKTKVDLKFASSREPTVYPGCAFPAIIITVRMEKQEERGGSRWSMSSAKWFATDLTSAEIPPMGASLPHLGSFNGRVFVVPFPNQYGDGSMCVGNNSYRTSYEDNWVAMNELYWHVLVGSPFNNDLSIPLKARSDDYSRPTYFRFLQTQDEFPYGIMRGHSGEDTFTEYLRTQR